MLKIHDQALMAAAELSSQYVADRYLPDKAIDLIDEASARVRLFGDKMPEPLRSSSDELKIAVMEKDRCVRSQLYEEAEIHHQRELELRETLATLNEKNPDYKSPNLNLFDRVVTYDDIAELVSIWTGIPVNKVSKAENSTLMNVEKLLGTRVIGQQVAVSSIAKAIKRSRMGFKNPNRPIGSFIFAGPTGVGKTELAKALASFFFGSESAMVRLDMSEYMERFNVSKLIGAPPGYVGFSDGGLLTEQVRRKPYSLVLFDEMEKAHGDVFNLLLQILEDGRLTDSQNRVIDFKNTLIILTSNVGASAIQKIQNEPQKPSNILASFMADEEVEVPDQYKRMASAVQAELKKSFKPEFLNRLDEVIIFQQLTKVDVREIAEIMFKQLVDRVEKQSQVTLTIPPAIVDKFAEDGFDPAYGARPLRRLITNVFEDRLINAFLAHDYKPGTKLSVRLNIKKEIEFYMIGFSPVTPKDSLAAIIADSIRNDVVLYSGDSDPVKLLLDKYSSKTKKTSQQRFKIRQAELRAFAIQNRINYFNKMYQMSIQGVKGKPHFTIDQFLARAGESFDNIIPYIDKRLEAAPTEMFDIYDLESDPEAMKMLNKCLEVEKLEKQDNDEYNEVNNISESDTNKSNYDIEKNN
jgi:ATP-dependent Clp protease ATP-binding subunit ClpC